MKNRTTPKGSVHIGKLRLRGRVLRDLIHGGGVPITIDEIDTDADIGGDVIHNPAPKRRKHKEKKRLGRMPKAISHGFAALSSVGAMVAASGVAHALGWV